MPTATRSCPVCATPLPEEAQFCLRCGAATPTDPGAPPRTAATGVVEVAKVRRALADRYRVERVLGEGGMATVYLAEDIKHHRKVALKVMRPELASTLGADRFLREIDIAARLSHPHILPVHDSGEADGVLYYVMPHVEGESLRERLHRHGRLPVEEAVRLAREVAEALAYASDRGIIHRDIKPANILLSAGHALVADFGIARAVGSDVTLTGTGLAVGTPQYMSPEQASGAKDVDARADIYAVGSVLYEMLAGQPPYTGDTPQAVLARALTEEVRPVTAVRPDVPRDVADVVRRALAREPADRQQTATELVAALSGALDAARTGGTAAVGTAPTPARVAGLFGIAAAGVLAAIYAVMRQAGLPPWTFALAVGLLAIGIPVLLLTRRVEAKRLAGREVRGLRRWLTWRNAVAGGVLAMLAWAIVATTLVLRGSDGAGGGPVTKIAVLPFTNLGAAEDAYFADGITDEVRGKLLTVPGFLVIARSSSVQYKDSPKTPQEIGRELGVDYLLNATVRWTRGGERAGRVQVVPELVDVRTGGVTWQQSFDAALTDVFRMQKDIAVRVAASLDVALGGAQERDLAARPTENIGAYDAFLKGEGARQSASAADRRQAVAYYDQAVALDSTFALAWARLAHTYSVIYFGRPSRESAERTRIAAERARALTPDAPETHLALGAYYAYVLGDALRAREQFAAGLAAAPNHAELLGLSAATERSLGRWDVAVDVLRRAVAVDPRSAVAHTNLASMLLWTRRYPEALAESEAALAVAPTSLGAMLAKTMVYLAQGDLTGARAVVRATPREVEPTRLIAFVAVTWDLFWLLDDDQQRVLLRLSPGAFDDDRAAWALGLAATHALRGDAARARAYGDSARLVLDENLRASPDDNYLLALHGVALAYAGRRNEAISDGERSMALLPVSKDAFSAPYNLHQLARVYTILGERDKAIDQLERLLAIPYFLSPQWLRIDPTFASLRGHPRFQRLTAGG
jgi:serine/threonine-protein kinase